MTVFEKFPRRIIRKVVMSVYDKECQYCRQRFDSSKLHLDRIHPGSEGGEYRLDNITLACQKCNLKKSNALLEEPGASLLKTIAKEKKEKIVHKLHKRQAPNETDSVTKENTDHGNSSRLYNGYHFLDTHIESSKHSYMLDVAVPTADFQVVFQTDGLDQTGKVDGLRAFSPNSIAEKYKVQGCRFHLPLPIDKLGLSLLESFWREYEAINLFKADESKSLFGEYEQHSLVFSVRLSHLTHMSVEDANKFFRALAWLMEIRGAWYGRGNNGWIQESSIRLCNKLSTSGEAQISSRKITFSHPHKNNGESLEADCTRVDSNPAEVMKSTTVDLSLRFSADIAERLRKVIHNNYLGLVHKPSLQAA